MGYTGHQKRVASHVYDVGRKSGANRKQLLAALETALVESNLGNPKGGHGTSSGWRQQITGAGVKSQNRQNVRQQAKYFFDEIKGAKGGTAGQMAQAVQRSAHPERYDAREKQAGDLLQHLEKTQGKGGGSHMEGGELKGKTRTTPGVDRSADRQALKISYLSNRNDPDALLNLSRGLSEAQDTPASKTLDLSRTPRRRVSDGGGGRISRGVRDGGGWGGTKNIAKGAGRGFIQSEKRTPQQNAAVGGAPQSDHLTTNKKSYAVDMKHGTGKKVAQRLGLKNWKPGTYDRHKVKVGGRVYSVQILEGVKGHDDHTHLGVRRVK